MIETFQNLLTGEDIQAVLGLRETWNPGDYKMDLSTQIRSKISQASGITLGDTVPLRFIQGDTPAHKDNSSGNKNFQKTFILYLHDSPGALVIDGQPFPITAGSAYSFDEGLQHYTEGAGPRLLIGPMDETGMAVGSGTLVQLDGAFGPIYIKQEQNNISYSTTNQESFSQIAFPITIQNMNENPTNNILKVVFLTDLTFTDATQYFILNSNGIQIGSESLRENGALTTITVSGIVDYPGLISVNDYDQVNHIQDSIFIYNIKVHVDLGTTLQTPSGWIAQPFFARNGINCWIVNCHSDGDISDYGGGIVGQYTFLISKSLEDFGGKTPSLKIIGCSSSGDLGIYAGGILGIFSGVKDAVIDLDPSYTLTVQGCWSTGVQNSVGAGGIFGALAGNSNANDDYTNDPIHFITLIADRCYSTGDLAAGGGIYGTGAFKCIARNCYATGGIYETSGEDCAGGIFGPTASYATAINCYTTGEIGAGNGGIFGSNSYNSEESVVSHLYVAGFNNDYNTQPGVIGDPPQTIGQIGYFVAQSTELFPDSNCYSEAKTGTGGQWDNDHANSVLQSVYPATDPVWIPSSDPPNYPYELFTQGVSPYTLTKVNVDGSILSTFPMSLSPGGISAAAVIAGAPFALLGAPAGVTIDTGTGAIMCASTVAPGTYTLIVRHSGSYYYSTVSLTVTGGDCCADPVLLIGDDYTTRVDVKAGDLIRQGPRFGTLAYSDLMRIRKANAFRR